MNMPIIIEKWDSLLFQAYNFLQSFKFLFISPKFKRMLRRNKQFKNLHRGKRCFVVLNGPSLNNYDLSFLKDEFVFASNYFYRSNLCSTIQPNFYCWLDSNVFSDPSFSQLFASIKKSCPNAKLFINSKGFIKTDDKDYFFTYHKHIPNVFSLKYNLSRICSNFSTVALYALSIAIYMGFSEIYIFGLDFEPGAFKHFANLGEDSNCTDPNQQKNKLDVFGNYWSYTKSHSEFYKLNEIAKRKRIVIKNLNRNSCVRAFEFADYKDLFA